MTMDSMNVSDRGFKQGEDILDEYGSKIRTYESSAAMKARIWLRAEGSDVLDLPKNEVALHMSIPEATALRDQLDYLIKNHYHNEIYDLDSESDSD